MAGKNDNFEFELLRLVFNGFSTGTVGQLATTAGTTTVWLALQTADPGDAGSTANEGGYTAYTRVQTMRSTAAAGWVVSSGTGATKASASPNAAITFPQVATTSTGTFSFFSVYPSSNAGASLAFYSGSVSPVINFSQNVTPSLTTGSSITED